MKETNKINMWKSCEVNVKASQIKMYRLNFRLQHDSNRQNSVCFYLGGRLHMHVPLCYTKARSLHLGCLKTPPTARSFAMIGCRLSRHWILTFTSLDESSSSIFTRSMGRSVVIFGSILKSNIWCVFDVFLDLVILVYFNAISIDLYVVKCFICIYFV